MGIFSDDERTVSDNGTVRLSCARMGILVMWRTDDAPLPRIYQYLPACMGDMKQALHKASKKSAKVGGRHSGADFHQESVCSRPGAMRPPDQP
jgi:hypothetical protein